MSMQNRSYSTVALWLLPLLILSSAGPSGNHEANTYPDFDVPWSLQEYETKKQSEGLAKLSNDTKTLFKQLDDIEQMEHKPKNPDKYSESESLPVDSEENILKQDKYHEFLGPLDVVLMNSARMGEFEQIISQRVKDWDRKPSEGQSKLLANSLIKKAQEILYAPEAEPTSTCAPSPSATKTTAVIRPSTFCLPDPTPFAPPPTQCAAPTTPKTNPTTRKPPVKPCPKRRKKSKRLSSKTAKILLDIILATKQHVLEVLKTLNYLEIEVLSQSPDDCTLQDSEPRKASPAKPKKKTAKQMEKPLKPPSSAHSQAFIFGIRPASQMESDSDKALAREEEEKLKSRVWEEHQELMRDMSSKLHVAPQAAVRLETIQKPQGPQEPLEHKNPLKNLPKKDQSELEDIWSLSD